MRSATATLDSNIKQKRKVSDELECTLWKNFKGGDKQAMDTLFRKYHTPLKRFGLKIYADADFINDCIQEMFLDFWMYRETIGEVQAVNYYMIKCLKRKVIKNLAILAKRKTTSITEVHDIFTIDCFESDWAKEQSSTQLENRIAKTLKGLSKRQQQAIELKFYQNKSYEEICKIMSLNYQSVKNLLHNSMKLLKHKISLKDVFGIFFSAFIGW